jgi:uncharacterized integral membrane protein (TIGR00697 family)
MHTTLHQKQYKYLTFFIVCFITCYLTSEVVINRLVSFGGGYITGGTFIYFISPMVTDVVTEVYGYRIARQMLWYGIFSWIFLGLGVALCLKAPHPAFWTENAKAYDTALGPLLHSSIISSFAVLTGQFINSYLISKWKVLLRGKYFCLRSVSSSIIGDAITVTLSILGIFAFRIPTDAFILTLLPEFIIMVIFSSVGAIPAVFLVNYIKKAENLDHYDVSTNFNPFKFAINDDDLTIAQSKV